MKIKYFYPGFIFLIIVVTTFAVQQNGKNDKIIKFSHGYHLTEAGAECSDCHGAVWESESMLDRLIPTEETCGECHDVEDEEECSTCHYDNVQTLLVPTKPTLYFNHKLHMKEKMECESCHKGLEDVNYSFESTELLPEMESCFAECHGENAIADNNCQTCHISTVALLPDNHKEVDFFDNHKFLADDPDENCGMCHNNSFCESCHVSTNAIVEINSASDFYTPYSPHSFTDNAKKQQIVRVHNLNYVYTHGIDAKGKETECLTCHQDEMFCVECHNSQTEDFALSGFVPLSHSQPGFTTIGVGSGGGEHAILAKRDIESCASCHDTEGADPSCILCHSDPDGIKGTNPKTHETNYMHDVEGDWHTSEGSVCYDCHTDFNARPDGQAGIGFCGYCHSEVEDED